MHHLTYTYIGERTEGRDRGSRQSERENGRWIDGRDDKKEEGGRLKRDSDPRESERKQLACCRNDGGRDVKQKEK